MTVARTNRSHAEVEAERQRRATEAAARDQRIANAMAEIAALNAEADLAAAEEENNTINSLGDLDEDAPVLEFTEEDFDRIEDEDAYTSADEYAPKTKFFEGKSKTIGVAKTKKTKPKKGETRAEVEQLTNALKAKGVGGKKNRVQNSDAAAASKKAGLSKSFLATTAKGDADPEKFDYGGLTEEDAESTRPDLDSTAAPAKRINEAIPAPRPVPKTRVAAPKKVKIEHFKIPALPISSETPMPKKSKKKVKLEAESSQVGFFTPESAGDVNGLPALVSSTWDSHVLPVVYRALACSTDPMGFVAAGDTAAERVAAVRMMRKIIDEVYPGNTLPQFVWGDKICSRMTSRVRERRSLIVQAGVDAGDTFFKTDKDFVGNSAAIRDYATYAIRFDGPAFWRVSTPRSSPREPKAADYIPAEGYMESPFILKAAKEFFKTAPFAPPEADAFDPSKLPIGFFGLIAAGVERGFKRYMATGVREEELPKFTRKLGNPRVATYIGNIQRFTITRWISLLTAVRPNATAAALAPEQFEAALEEYREHAYVPSSP
ncbi:hypothetical protein GGX14DRAFT_541299 [Mycena pura]|uniref:Uncharacterized protein n=1 Tax=Mycena pura TaxID=153505 RepID=A0AAD6VTT7_9AGAR|nr:hypothetical protein GGX14DRAFT_541299 [Mycena pura]